MFSVGTFLEMQLLVLMLSNFRCSVAGKNFTPSEERGVRSVKGKCPKLCAKGTCYVHFTSENCFAPRQSVDVDRNTN